MIRCVAYDRQDRSLERELRPDLFGPLGCIYKRVRGFLNSPSPPPDPFERPGCDGKRFGPFFHGPLPLRQEQRYRSRSPPRQHRRTPPLYQLSGHATSREPDPYPPCSPDHARYSNAVMHEHRNSYFKMEDRAAPGHGLPLQDFSMVQISQPGLRRQPPPSFGGPFPQEDTGVVLQEMDTNARLPQSLAIKGCQSQARSQVGSLRAFKDSPSHGQKTPTRSPQLGDNVRVGDPRFVLGVTRGAGRNE